MKDATQDCQLFGFAHIVQQDGVNYGDFVGEVGMDADDAEVGDHQQRRVVEGFAVAEQLAVGGVQIPVQALEFPGEVALLVDVGAAAASGGFADGTLKGIPFLAGIHFGGRAVFHYAAQVKEPLLGAGGFPAPGAAPLGDKVLRRDGRLGNGRLGWGGHSGPVSCEPKFIRRKRAPEGGTGQRARNRAGRGRQTRS